MKRPRQPGRAYPRSRRNKAMVASNQECVTHEPQWIQVGSAIQVDPSTATVRIHEDVVDPTKLDILPHLMPVAGLDRPATDPRSDLVVYIRCEHRKPWVYVQTHDVKRMKGEPVSKPFGYCLASEVEAETSVARELVDEVAMRRAVVGV